MRLVWFGGRLLRQWDGRCIRDASEVFDEWVSYSLQCLIFSSETSSPSIAEADHQPDARIFSSKLQSLSAVLLSRSHHCSLESQGNLFATLTPHVTRLRCAALTGRHACPFGEPISLEPLALLQPFYNGRRNLGIAVASRQKYRSPSKGHQLALRQRRRHNTSVTACCTSCHRAGTRVSALSWLHEFMQVPQSAVLLQTPTTWHISREI